VLAAIAALLLVANCGVIFIRVGFGIQWFFGINQLFDLDGESNLPTLFSTGLFLINSGLLFCVASIQPTAGKPSPRLPWVLLAAIFGFLGIDESVSIHELFVVAVREALDAGGVFYFAWVIPYGVATLGLAAVLAPWFWRLDRRTQLLFGSSAVLFVVGSLGLEMVAGHYLESMLLKKDLVFQVMYTIEETLEMSGLILFAYGLMDFLRRQQGVSLSLDIERTDDVAHPRIASQEVSFPRIH
jgi:hypothetical protein